MATVVTVDLSTKSADWLARHEKAMKRIRVLEAQTRTLMRTFAPQIAPEQDGIGIRRCRHCNPPPQLHKCPVCDWETEDRWRLKLHIDLNPLWCQERGARKARKWASRV